MAGWLDSRGRGMVLALLIAGGSVAAHAAQREAVFDPFEVRDISVSAVAADAVAAKDIAMRQAFSVAAARVLRRVASAPSDVDLSPPDPELLVSGYAFAAELVAPTAYTATLTVTLSPMLVRGYLARRGIGVVDQAAPPVLLIPVLIEDGATRWWEAAEEWTAALAAQDMAEGLTPVRLAKGTSQDRAARRELLLAADVTLLGEFRVRYRAHSAVVTVLDRSDAGTRMLLSMRGEDAAGPVDIAVELEEGGLAAAAGQVASTLSQRWKRLAAGLSSAHAGAGHSVPVRVLLTRGSGEWEDLRRRLESSAAVTGLAVESIGETSANVVIWHSGSLDDLPRRLSASGLDLFEAGGAWLLQAY